MNLTQLEYYVTTVSKGSFSQAGKTLFVTPQAIAKAVSDLEKELKAKLLVRSAQRISPTDFGLLFAKKAEEILESVQELHTFTRSHFESLEMQGEITLCIAVFPYRGSILKQSAVEEMHLAYPQLHMRTFFDSGDACFSAVESDLVDAAIVLGRVDDPDIECTKLATLELCVALSADNPLSSKEYINISELKTLSIARPCALRYCYSAITERLLQHKIEPQYVEVQPFRETHQKFLTCSKSAMFVAGDQQLYELYEGIAIKRLAENERILIPICLINKKQKTTHLIQKIGNHLICLGKEAVISLSDAES